MAEKIEIIAELKDLVSNHLKDINSQIDRMDGKLSSIGSKGIGGGGGSTGLMGSVLSANLLTGAITRAGGAMYDFGKDSLDAYGKQEQFLISLKTMFQGNEKEAESLNGRLMTLAKTTPFELTEIQDATKMMIAYGSTSGGVVDELRMLGDVSSGVGSSVKEIAYLYGTLKTQGVAHTMDIRQFAGRGIPIIKELAKQLKVSEKEVGVLTEKGKIGFKEIEQAFKGMTKEGGQFFNMMEEQSKSQVGMVSNLSDAWDQFKAGLGENLTGIFKGVIAQLTSGLNDANVLLQNFNKSSKIFDKEKLGYSFKENFAFGQKAEMTGIEEYLSSVTEYAGKGDKESGLAKRALQGKLKSIATNYNDEKTIADTNGDDGPDAKKLLRQVALLKDAIGTIDEGSRSRKAETDKTAASEPKKLETLAKANRPTQTIINIENLVRELTNTYQQVSKGMELSAEQVAKILTGAVNDISVLPGG